MKFALFAAAAFLLAGCVGAVDTSENGGSLSQADPRQRSSTPAEATDEEAAPTDNTGSLTIVVVDGEQYPVAAAQVLLADTDLTAFTNARGFAVLNNLEPATYTALAAKPGYDARQQRGVAVEVEAGAVAEVTLHLEQRRVVDEVNAYYTSLNFRGFAACSYYGVMGYTSYCARGLAADGTTIWNDPRDNSTHRWSIENEHIKDVILEADWEPTVAALGGELWFRTSARWGCDVYACGAKNPVGPGMGGPSPIYYRQPEGPKNMWTAHTGSDASTYPHDVWTEARAHCINDSCGTANPTNNNFVISQPYNVWASAFYGREAPDAWSIYAPTM